jgi:hypothetical protein
MACRMGMRPFLTLGGDDGAARVVAVIRAVPGSRGLGNGREGEDGDERDKGMGGTRAFGR